MKDTERFIQNRYQQILSKIHSDFFMGDIVEKKILCDLLEKMRNSFYKIDVAKYEKQALGLWYSTADDSKSEA